jgi:hypothetical protein
MVHGNTTVRRDDMVRATTTTISTNPAIIDLSRFGVHVRAGTAFILTRKLAAQNEVLRAFQPCPAFGQTGR